MSKQHYDSLNTTTSGTINHLPKVTSEQTEDIAKAVEDKIKGEVFRENTPELNAGSIGRFVSQKKSQLVSREEPLKWNVVPETDFRADTMRVFAQVAGTLEKTLGPFGATTIIESYGDAYFTKDGWQVLKKIFFKERIHQTIHKLLINISSQVVIKVGDGSTSSIVSANEIMRQFNEDKTLSALRPKELVDALKHVVHEITEAIHSQAQRIDKDDQFEEIYRLAMISTNGEEEISRNIQEIYKSTNNPSIEFVKAKTDRTSFEIIKGYKSDFKYLDPIFQMNENGECILDHPVIVMFDHTLDMNHYTSIIRSLVEAALKSDRRVLVIAPHYDKMLRDRIGQEVNHIVRSGQLPPVVYANVVAHKESFKTLYHDFAALAGGRIITETDMFYMTLTPEIIEQMPEEQRKSIPENLPVVNDFLGEVGKAVLTGSHMMSTEFDNRNDMMYELLLNDARKQYNEKSEKYRQLNIIDLSLFELKKRISKLQCNMGVIHVGGGSEMEKAALYDLVEDAVKACESAYNYGFNLGGNLSIPITIDALLEKNEYNEFEKSILTNLRTAFLNVYKKVLLRRYVNDMERVEAIANEAVATKQCYNLITEEFDNNVINPSHTDTEILNAASSIISLLLGSNQYIALEIFSDHN